MNTASPDSSSKELILRAEDALKQAYAPYSGFHVGAALLMEDGSVITGSNQENAAYPLCMCAERVAFYTKASVCPDLSVVAMAVVARKIDGESLVPATPCGACRQVLVEFESRQARPFQVIMLTEDKGWLTLPSAQTLLPFSFSRHHLLG